MVEAARRERQMRANGLVEGIVEGVFSSGGESRGRLEREDGWQMRLRYSLVFW